ncbi:MAG: thioredoxin family protein [Atribacterota bacterium]|jgi:thioredoxin-related protein|nr:thioredoxin family protein [Atribacterota bacterium]MDY0383069.1 thioredoxin family protein [Atribacterota bacterium]
MLKMKVFWQKDCPNCPKAKEIGKKLEKELEVQYCDVDTVDGLTEACLYQVMSTPSLVVIDEKGEEIESWKGILPEIDYIRKKISNR